MKSTAYCIINRDHPSSDGGTSCAARAKTLQPVAGPHESGVRHAHHVGAEETDCNLGQWFDAGATQPISARVRGERAANFGLSAQLFRESMEWAQVSTVDAAAALNHNSSTQVKQWRSGARTIPADAVYVWMRRLPALGARILAFCAAELPEKHRAELPALIDEALAFKRRMMGGGK